MKPGKAAPQIGPPPRLYQARPRLGTKPAAVCRFRVDSQWMHGRTVTFFKSTVFWGVTPSRSESPTFLRNVLSPSSLWAKQETNKASDKLSVLLLVSYLTYSLTPKIEGCDPPKRRAFPELHGITTQKTVPFTVTAMTASNSTKWLLIIYAWGAGIAKSV
jgi:hypothetical protein